MCLYPLKCILLFNGPIFLVKQYPFLSLHSWLWISQPSWLDLSSLFSVSVLICWICIVRSTASGKWLSFPGETTYILNSHILWMSQLSQCCLFQSWHVCSYLSSGIWLCFWHFLLLPVPCIHKSQNSRERQLTLNLWAVSSPPTSPVCAAQLKGLGCRQCCRLSAKTLLTECAPNILLSAGYWMTFLDV